MLTRFHIWNFTYSFFSFLFEGDIPDLYSEDEVDTIISSTRMELRGLGQVDSKENCWQFFIDRIRQQLKVKLENGYRENIYSILVLLL